MKAIVELTPSEYEKANEVWRNLRSKVGENYTTRGLLDNLQRTSGYAHYTFEGSINPHLVELLGRAPTADEIIMLVDTGFSNFGASCMIMDGNFYGKVYTD